MGSTCAHDHFLVRFFYAEPAAAPTNLQFYEVTDDKITITWSGPSSDVSGYRVIYGPVGAGGTPQEQTELPITRNAYVDVTPLQPGTLYRFYIYTVHEGVESPPLVGEQATSESWGAACQI